MEIAVSQEQGRVPVTVMHLKGSIDSSTYTEFQTAVLDMVHSGARYILLDLKDVPYMSSAGLRALNSIYSTLREKDESVQTISKGVSAGTYKSPHLKLLSPGKRVIETLKMSGFDMFLEIHSNLKSAVESF